MASSRGKVMVQLALIDMKEIETVEVVKKGPDGSTQCVVENELAVSTSLEEPGRGTIALNKSGIFLAVM